MINTLLIVLFVAYLISVCVYAIIVNERVVLKTDIVSKVEHAKYIGTRSKIDTYHMLNKDYHIESLYHLIPRLRVILERNRNQLGNEVSYYVDKSEINKYEKRIEKRYTDIGITVGKDCPKKAWYWFTLLSYVQKNSNFGFISVSLFILWLVFYRPLTPVENVILWCMIFYYIIWALLCRFRRYPPTPFGDTRSLFVASLLLGKTDKITLFFLNSPLLIQNDAKYARFYQG